MRKFFSVFTFVLGLSVAFSVPTLFAHNVSTSLIRACVKDQDGNIRIIEGSENCKKNEHLLTWNQPTAFPSPSSLPTQNFVGGFINNDLSNKNFSVSGGTPVNYEYRNFSGVNFTNSVLYIADLNYADLRNSNLTGATLDNSSLEKTLVSGAIFVSTQINNASVDADFSSVNLSNASFINTQTHHSNFNHANLTHVNFTEANLSGSLNFSTATIKDVIWSNTTCPDNTNSDAHNHSCVGHF